MSCNFRGPHCNIVSKEEGRRIKSRFQSLQLMRTPKEV